MKTTHKLWLAISAALLLVCFLGIAYAQGATAVLKWDAPTQHTDNSAITAVLSYNVYGAAKGAAKVKLTTISAGATTATLTAQATNTCYDVTAVESGVGESQHSNELCLSSPPNKPGNLRLITVTIEVQ